VSDASARALDEAASCFKGISEADFKPEEVLAAGTDACRLKANAKQTTMETMQRDRELSTERL
jgi:hypothetical protein